MARRPPSASRPSRASRRVVQKSSVAEEPCAPAVEPVDLEQPPSDAAALRPSLAAEKTRPVGLDEAIDRLTFGFVKPLLGQGLFKSFAAPSGAVLHGPPGTGKTMMAMHCLTRNKIKFVYLKVSDIHSKYIGVTE
ncbi:hypothetical protein OC845_006864, partial [Tilletia horrida]